MSVQTLLSTVSNPYPFASPATYGAATSPPLPPSSYRNDRVSPNSDPQQPQIPPGTVPPTFEAIEKRHKRRLIEIDVALMTALSGTAVIVAKTGLLTKAADALDRKRNLAQEPHVGEPSHGPPEKNAAMWGAKPSAPRPAASGHFATDLFRKSGEVLTDGSHWGERFVQYGFISSMFGLGFNAIQTAYAD